MSFIVKKNIAVVFNTISLDDLDGKQGVLVEDIGDSAKSSKLFNFRDSINIYMLQAKIENEEAAVLIMLSDEKKTDCGMQLHTFKQKVINNFKDINIVIGNDDILFDFRSDQEIEEFIQSAKSLQQSKKIQMVNSDQ